MVGVRPPYTQPFSGFGGFGCGGFGCGGFGGPHGLHIGTGFPLTSSPQSWHEQCSDGWPWHVPWVRIRVRIGVRVRVRFRFGVRVRVRFRVRVCY